MIKEYYLRDPAGKTQGPYDLLTMVRWIRTGKLTRTTPLMPSLYDDAQPAERYDELRAVFEEEAGRTPHVEPAYIPESPDSFRNLMSSGWENFRTNQVMAVVTGIFVIVYTLGIMLLALTSSPTVLYLGMALWFQPILTLYMLIMLRKSRHQLLTSLYFGQLIGGFGPRLMAVSLITALCWSVIPALLTTMFGPIALLLWLIPGTLILSYLIFVPLVLVEEDVGVGSAFVISMRRMRESGIDFYTTIYAMVIINIIAPFLPITMPVTFAALANLYDRDWGEG